MAGEEMDVLPEQPSDDPGSVQEGPEDLHGGDAHTSADQEDEEASGQEEGESDSGSNDPEVPTPDGGQVDLPRRSERPRRPPRWFTSGDYAMVSKSRIQIGDNALIS